IFAPAVGVSFADGQYDGYWLGWQLPFSVLVTGNWGVDFRLENRFFFDSKLDEPANGALQFSVGVFHRVI
ncbi:MAG: hypothetical protein RBU37_22100, partial [Myxococcota bacterium]|nr:hypothetical protein [Myxococcota bacterium]